MSPSAMNGVSTSYRCRSEPQMPVEVIRTIASVGSWIVGSGTVSTRTSRLPCQVTAFMVPPSGVAVAVPEQAGYPAAMLGNAHAGLFAHQRTQRVWRERRRRQLVGLSPCARGGPPDFTGPYERGRWPDDDTDSETQQVGDTGRHSGARGAAWRARGGAAPGQRRAGPHGYAGGRRMAHGRLRLDSVHQGRAGTELRHDRDQLRTRAER